MFSKKIRERNKQTILTIFCQPLMKMAISPEDTFGSFIYINAMNHIFQCVDITIRQEGRGDTHGQAF